jgi:hypothetical protein
MGMAPSNHALVDHGFCFGRYFHLRAVALVLAIGTGILLAHMMDALEVTGKIFHLPALIRSNRLTLLAAAAPGSLFTAQLVDVRA